MVWHHAYLPCDVAIYQWANTMIILEIQWCLIFTVVLNRYGEVRFGSGTSILYVIYIPDAYNTNILDDAWADNVNTNHTHSARKRTSTFHFLAVRPRLSFPPYHTKNTI